MDITYYEWLQILSNVFCITIFIYTFIYSTIQPILFYFIDNLKTNLIIYTDIKNFLNVYILNVLHFIYMEYKEYHDIRIKCCRFL